MERNQERRGELEKRVPIRAAATLAENRDDAFEADAVNLSRGGMSLRSQCLPDVGARLWCRFEHPPSGSVIEAEGEVVWAQLEGESGEIGLAFTTLDPETEHLIEQIIAQHGSPTAAGAVIDASEQDRIAAELDAESEAASSSVAHDVPRQPTSAGRESAASLPPMPAARVANLSLEGIPEPLAAHVAELSRDYAVFEQVLPLLKLGRSVSADAPELQGRRGAIAGVELRMMGHVPTLAVIVDFANGSDGPVRQDEFGEASFSSTDVPALSQLPDESLAHDTEPDLDSPADEPSHPGMAPSPAQRVTAAEFSASPVSQRSAKPKQLALDVPQEPAAAPRMAARIEPKPVAEEAPRSLASSSGEPVRPSARGELEAAKVARPVNHRLDATQVVQLPDASDGDDDLDDASFGDSDPFAPAPPAWRPFALAAMRALHALAALLKLGALRGAKLLGATGVAALPRARMFMVRARAVARQATIVIAPKLGAAKRLAAAQLGKKKRRTTAGGAAVTRESSDTGSLVRTIGLGALVTVIAGLGVYAVLPASDPELELHRKVEAPAGEAGLSGGEAPPAEPAAAQALDLAQPSTIEPALPMPSAATVPAGSAFAVDVRERAPAKAAAPVARPAAPAPKAAPRSMRFGAATAPARAQTFALRMSKPIASINGLADAGGFTVIVNGSLSLDRAGPISAAHRGVARAMVLNKGDRSELTIRFVDGKKPAYQVRADGQTLYVVIEDV